MNRGTRGGIRNCGLTFPDSRLRIQDSGFQLPFFTSREFMSSVNMNPLVPFDS
jgi:hypothetical protein